MAFEYQPTLGGPPIDLRPLRDSDHDALFAVAADPAIWEQHPVPRERDSAPEEGRGGELIHR
jgi:N-acetyltransferase